MKNVIVSIVIVFAAWLAAPAHASEIVEIDGDVITLDNGDQIQVQDMDGIHVGDEVSADTSYTVDSTGATGEEY